MFRTDQTTAVTSLPVPAAAGTPGYFTGGNPAIGQAATILDADWLNMVQEELCNLVVAAGLTLSKTTYSQILAAIHVLGSRATVLADVGSANAYAAENPTPMSALPATSGVVQVVQIAHANTGASTYAPDGLPSAPIFGAGGAALQGGELVAGSLVTLVSYVGPLLNGGAVCWILARAVGGAQQVGAAAKGGHAVQLAQLLSAGGYWSAFAPSLSVPLTNNSVANLQTLNITLPANPPGAFYRLIARVSAAIQTPGGATGYQNFGNQINDGIGTYAATAWLASSGGNNAFDDTIILGPYSAGTTLTLTQRAQQLLGNWNGTVNQATMNVQAVLSPN